MTQSIVEWIKSAKVSESLHYHTGSLAQARENDKDLDLRATMLLAAQELRYVDLVQLPIRGTKKRVDVYQGNGVYHKGFVRDFAYLAQRTKKKAKKNFHLGLLLAAERLIRDRGDEGDG